MTRPDQTRPDQTRPDQHYCLNSSHEKILLVTLYGNFNYGNVLQRLALAGVLESLGFEVDHLCPLTPAPKVKVSGRKIFERRIKTFIKRMLALAGIKRFWLRELEYRAKAEQAERRRQEIALFESKIKPFQDKYITRRIYMTRDEVLSSEPKRWEAYKFAVTGRDQVWHNWSRSENELAYYYLEFMPREKRINYAPSFGFSEFMSDDYELHEKGLAGFERLSSREQEGGDMIKELTGRDAEFVLDPTLLLNAEQWRCYESKPADISERYILCYFLGSLPPAYLRTIKNTAGNLPVINILNTENALEVPEFHNCRVTPSEFLYLIRQSEFVCTNSFHGTAFSINFQKNFLAFKRKQRGMEDMFNRIESLLAALGLTDNVYKRFMTSRPENINYELVNKRLDLMREKSIKYLKNCLKA